MEKQINMPGCNERVMKYGGIALVVGYVIINIIIFWYVLK